MGFFSWNCKGCGKSIKAPYECEPLWHNDAVAILDNGSVLMGRYDGYGRINDTFELESPCLWHEKCWIEAGKPTDYRGESDNASDQGFFYE